MRWAEKLTTKFQEASGGPKAGCAWATTTQYIEPPVPAAGHAAPGRWPHVLKRAAAARGASMFSRWLAWPKRRSRSCPRCRGGEQVQVGRELVSCCRAQKGIHQAR